MHDLIQTKKDFLDVLLLRRTEELWAGLRRVYFGEVEDPLDPDDTEPSSKRPRTRENVAAFKRELSDTLARIRRLEPSVPDDLNVPIPRLPPRHDDPDNDNGRGSVFVTPSSALLSSSDSDAEDFELAPFGDISNGEGDKWERDNDGGENDEDDLKVPYFSVHYDKYEAAVAIQPHPGPSQSVVHGDGRKATEAPEIRILNGEDFKNPLENRKKNIQPHPGPSQSVVHGDGRKETEAPEIRILNGEDFKNPLENRKKNDSHFLFKKELEKVPIGEEVNEPELEEGLIGEKVNGWSRLKNFGRRILLSIKTMRRVLASKETLHKYGVFVPRNNREADLSPEATRWSSGRQLEWLRLQEQGTFERNWDWARLRKAYPQYRKQDIGHVFFVYDHKHSGEHRVRLVFDGSKQSPETYSETYAPTARGESVRLFHVYAVEEAWSISQFDVPQAFLKSKIDCDIFVYPPKNFSEFPGQLLKLRLALYGAKQSAALWNQLINGFLLGLGFSPSPMDPCLYKRDDAIIILFCDDLRVAGLPGTVATIKAALFDEFQITTSDGTRFLGMDTVYDQENGHLKLHMETYITQTYQRFTDFDITRGVPFRELVGCMLWICLCLMGPELLRVKDLARRSNSYNDNDYKDAIKVLNRIYEKRHQGIIFFRGGAGQEITPMNSRTAPVVSEISQDNICDDTGGSALGFNELREKLLYKVKDEIAAEDICPVRLPINSRYRLTIYADASFAVGELKQSVSGYLVFLNGTPLLWGSLKQTIVVDSSCSAEYVAASVACKQAIHAENLIGFLGFSCSKPYAYHVY